MAKHNYYPETLKIQIVESLLARESGSSFREAYEVFHDLEDAFRDKDHSPLFELLEQLPESLDKDFRKKLRNLLKYEEGIRDTMIYPYSNGKIEAKNTHIKTLKRVSYGFKSFENMRIRIYLNNHLIEVK